MLEVQTDGAATERFQIIFLFDNAKTALTGAVFLWELSENRSFGQPFFYLPDSAAVRHASSCACMRRGASSKIAFCASFVFGAS